MRGMRIGVGLVAMLALAGCAGTPDFTELSVRVEPPAGLEPGADTELQVRLSGRDGILAETHTTPSGSGPWPVTLRFDRHTFEAARSPRLTAELRQQGSLTHVSPEPVAIASPEAAPVSLPLVPRR